MYAMDNKGLYPAVRDSVNIKTSTGAAAERRWTDLLAKYFSRSANNFQSVDDITKVRRNSVLWGCPEYTKANDYDSSYADKVYNGYGMQYAPGFPERYDNETNAFRAANPLRKGYLKQSLYTRKGAERVLVADSRYDYIAVPSATISTATYKTYDGFKTGKVGLWPWIQSIVTEAEDDQRAVRRWARRDDQCPRRLQRHPQPGPGFDHLLAASSAAAAN
jgi:hypothetical protein